MSDSRRQRDKAHSSFHGRSAEGRHFSASVGDDFTNGRRGMARAVRGAKKYVRSRIRFHDKAALKSNLDSWEWLGHDR